MHMMELLMPGGSGKAEGFADGERSNHRQAGACRCHPGAYAVLRKTGRAGSQSA